MRIGEADLGRAACRSDVAVGKDGSYCPYRTYRGCIGGACEVSQLLHVYLCHDCISICREGKIKYIGLCECNGETLRRAYKVHPIAAVQVEYSPFTLDPEDPKIGTIQAARELGITVFAYSPLGRGLLTGKYVRPTLFLFFVGDLRSGSVDEPR
jgi:hypothetical protein